jgi:hypothetical protein
MLKTFKPLRYSAHGSLMLQPATDYGFARDLLMVPLALPELAQAAREFPIVFPANGHPVAVLMGLEAGRNTYVGAKGQWLAQHVPAFVRQPPFAMGKSKPAADGQQNSVLLLDTASARLSLESGEPLFNPDKTPAPVVVAALKSLQAMEASRDALQAAVNAIDEAGLLIERVVRMRTDKGEGKRVAGIRVIDEPKLNALKDKNFNALRKAGALPLVYAHLLSWGNFRRGPIGRAYPRAAQEDAAASLTGKAALPG